MPKLISVIIPTFNRASVLPRALLSILNQSFIDFECIVVDDGSTDNSQQICLAFQESFKEKEIPFYYISYTKNKGVSFARNLAIKKSKSPWIAFLDSDDEWLPLKLEQQINYSKQYPSIKLIHGEEIWIRNGVRVNPKKKHQKRGGYIFEDCLKLCLISPSCVLIKRELLLMYKGFREDFEVCEDYDLWLKITRHNEVGFINNFLIKKFGGAEDQLSKKLYGMDYFRVKSLIWILQNTNFNLLNKNQKSIQQKVTDLILKKIKILKNGAKKRENFTFQKKIEDLEKLLNI